MAERPERSPGVHATLSVLETLAARGPLALSDLAAELGVAKSTLHRVCAILAARGWVGRDADGRFELGIRAISLGARTSELPIVTAFRSTAAGLLTLHDETVALAVLDGADSVIIALEETSQPVRLVTHVGSRTPAFASASGRVILADRAPGVVAAELGGRPLVTPTGRRLQGVSELHAILEEVRRRGYAENDEETAVGLYSVSVPVRNSTGHVLAALTMCIPTSRAGPERRTAAVESMLETGVRLSAEVAWLHAWDATRVGAGLERPAAAGRP